MAKAVSTEPEQKNVLIVFNICIVISGLFDCRRYTSLHKYLFLSSSSRYSVESSPSLISFDSDIKGIIKFIIF